MNASRVIETFGSWGGYTLEEAVSLMNLHVVKKEHFKKNKTPDIEKLGYIAGVVSLNDEIEVIVKFHEEMLQLTKEAVSQQIHIIPDDDDDDFGI